MAWWMLPAAAATAVGAFAGNERTNRINQNEAQKNRDFQAGEAATNRTFQERMRNTSWQAAVADMHAAGLNPALAYSQGPAASPGGSMAGGSQAAPASDSYSSALQAMQQQKTLKLLDAQVKKTESEAASASADAKFNQNRWTWLTQNEEGSPYSRFDRWMRTELGNMIANGQMSLANSNYLNTQTRLAPYRSIGTAAGSIFDYLRNEGGRSINQLFRPRGN